MKKTKADYDDKSKNTEPTQTKNRLQWKTVKFR